LSGFDLIAALLRGTRRRLLLLHAACGAAELLLLAGGALLLALLLHPPLGLLRPLLWSVWAAALVAVVIRQALLLRRSAGSDERVARFVEQRLPGLGSGLINAVQLRRVLGDPERARALSPALAEAAVEDAARRVVRTPLAGLVSTRPLRSRLLVVAGLALCWALAQGLAPRRLSDGLSALLAPPLEHAETAPAERVATPVLGDVTLVYRYPAHTGLPDRRVEGSDGRVRALSGTTVELTARTLEPAAAAAVTVTVKEGEPIAVALVVEGDGVVRGTLTVTAAGSWRAELTAADGGGQVGPEHPIEVVEDARPSVELLAPAEDLELNPGDSLDLTVRARDDYGLGKVTLVWRVVGAGGEPSRLPLEEELAGRKDLRVERKLPLGSLQVEPGDQVALFIEATDNDGVNGAKTGESATRIVRVRSPEQKHNELMAQLSEAVEALLDLLADRLEAEPPIEKPSDLPAISQSVVGLTAKTLVVVARLTDLLAALQEDPLAREDLVEGVRLSRDGIDRRHRREEGALAGVLRRSEAGRLRASHLAPLRKASEDSVVATEKAILRLDELRTHQAMADLKQLSEQLMASQQRLRDLLEEYKRSPDPDTKRRILRELARLRVRIEAMLRRLAELRKKVPLEHLNRGALEKGLTSKAVDLAERMAQVAAALEQGETEAALKELEQLANELQAMASQLGEDAGQLEKAESVWRRELGAMQKATEDVRARQQKLAQATEALERAADERLAKEVERRMKGDLEALQRRVESLRETLHRVPAEALDGRAAEQHAQLNRSAEQLAEWLARRDVGMAVDVAEATVEQARRLRGELARQATFPPLGRPEQPYRKGEREATRAEGQAERIRDQLEELMPDPSSRLDAGEQRAMERLEGRQGKLRSEVAQLEERMDALQQFLPLEAGKMEGQLRRAGGHMEDATEELGREAARRAHDAQEKALAELAQAQQSMQKTLKPEQQEPDEGGGKRTSHERVEIVHDRRSADEYRKEIMEGMKRQAPEPYQEQVRQYYRELIR